MDRRRLEEAVVKALMLLSTGLITGSLGAILGVVLWRGRAAFNVAILTRTSQGGYSLGQEGGILNAIVGSLCLAGGATALALLLALPAALFLQSDYAGRSRWASWCRLSFDALWGVPSIVYGAFGFTLMLLLGMRASLLAGMVVLVGVEWPIMVRAMDEVLRLVSAELKEAAYALGSTPWETMQAAVLRQALPGLVTAVLLALGRGIGDAASILFTAGYSDYLPRSLGDPVASLPLAVFFQLATPFPEVQQRAYAAAAVLLSLVLLISLASRWLARRLGQYVLQ
jgi:phosphate transport system permease protein